MYGAGRLGLWPAFRRTESDAMTAGHSIGGFGKPHSATARLAIVLHNHQPVGNFDHVIEDALNRSYRPFLETLSDFPSIRVVLHHSGCLLEWLCEHAPDYVDQVRAAVERGQVELLGGPIDEPILAAIPRRDRTGQIRMHHQLLKDVFGVDVQGIWVPERVWNHTFTGDLAASGVQYTVLDDAHFRGAGLADAELTGAFVCEDEGRVLQVFPIHERLRYIIPFHTVDDVFDEIRSRAESCPGGLMVFADDGEKFGVWPGTHKSVYEEGWLRTFLQRLTEASDWLETVTLAEASQSRPIGRVALPDTSYREMTEWVLPADRQSQLVEQRQTRPETDPDWPAIRDFIRGGTWGNFLAKYPEAGEMAARMKEVSARIALAKESHPEAVDQLKKATRALYRAQCNCPYWHGAFGGLYLSHLRQATYRNLIEADSIVYRLTHQSDGVAAETHDFNFDLHPEIKLTTSRLAAYVAPAQGGQLYELDVRGCGTNLLATLARRPEPYHDRLSRNGDEYVDNGELIYDRRPRRSLVDRFLTLDVDEAGYQRGDGELGDSSTAEYSATVRRTNGAGAERVECRLTCNTALPDHELPIEIAKTVIADADRPGDLEVEYKLSGLQPGREYRFAVEFNLAGLAPGADDRYVYDSSGRKVGPVNSEYDFESIDRLGAVDEWLGLDVAFDWSRVADVWVFPIETVSGSEAGIEKTYQSTCVVPHWRVTPDEDGEFEVSIRMSCDTSAAEARKLFQPSRHGSARRESTLESATI